jgi:hypothetical protein
LPNDTTMEGRTFPKVEERISAKLQQLSKDILLENLTEEARLAFEASPTQDHNEFDQWKQAPKKHENGMVLGLPKYAKIDCSFDMGWQQRSSGNRYASQSGDALLVGCITRKPIAMIVKSKLCNFCNAWNKKNLEDPPPHDCKANHGGSSSAMEPVACLEMVVDLYDSKHCIINRICCDDDASTRSMLRWSNRDYMTNTGTTVPPTVAKTKGAKAGEQQARPDKGKLPGRIPEPKFVADPNHRKKVFTGDLWKIHAKGVADKMTITKMDINRLGTGFGFMIKSLHKRPTTEWLDAANAVVEHHFDEHKYCGAWCRRKTMTDLQLQSSERYYRCKNKDAKLYSVLTEVIARFITFERLEEVGHGFDTQINESFNNTASWFAPKNKVYCGSQSLENRLSMAVGINSIGLHRYFTRLYTRFGITMDPCVSHYLAVKENVRDKRHEKNKLRKTKIARKEKQYVTLRQQEQAAKKERAKRDGTYKTGQNMEAGGADGYTLDELLAAAAKKPRIKRSRKDAICPLCQKAGHTTARSRKCTYYKVKIESNNEVQPDQENVQMAVITDRLDSQHLMDDDSVDQDVFVDAATWDESSLEEERTPTMAERTPRQLPSAGI